MKRWKALQRGLSQSNASSKPVSRGELHNGQRVENGPDICLKLLSDDANRPLLVPQMTPAMQAAAVSSIAGHDMTPHAKAALILDAEHDIRTLERELREIESLEKRGAAGSGRLAGV